MAGVGQQVRDAVLQSAKEIAPAWRRSIVQNFNAGGRPLPWMPRRNGGGGKTLIGKARLMNSISVHAESNGDKASMVARTAGIIYARIHQLGGTIVPKNAKNLAIPMTPEAEGRSPKDWKKGELFFLNRPGVTGSGNPRSGFLCSRGKGKGEVVAQYALLKSVRIVKREYIVFQDEDRDLATKILDRHLRAVQFVGGAR